MNKERYEVPVTEIIVFETEDIITTSGVDQGDLSSIDPLTGLSND